MLLKVKNNLLKNVQLYLILDANLNLHNNLEKKKETH